MSLVNLGLMFIIFGWLVQLSYVTQGNKELQPAFLVIYVLGVTMLVAGTSRDYFQLMTLITSLLVLVSLVSVKERKKRR